MNDFEDSNVADIPAAVTEIEKASLNQHIGHLSVAVETILTQTKGGLSELHLIKALQKEPWQLIGEVEYSSPEKLFPIHFLLFHVLYRLRDQLARDGQIMELSPLRIAIEEGKEFSASSAISTRDELRSFYLDLGNYALSADSIRQMVDDFWAGNPSHKPDRDEIQTAAEVLGFEGVPDNFATIKQQFRRIVMKQHPDRGGSTAVVQELNQAFSVLKRHYQT